MGGASTTRYLYVVAAGCGARAGIVRRQLAAPQLQQLACLLAGCAAGALAGDRPAVQRALFYCHYQVTLGTVPESPAVHVVLVPRHVGSGY